jgi:hypothetical protein
MAKMRKLCSYPMSLFFVYEDEVPPNTSVCTMEDCTKCNDRDGQCCSEPYCLITE